MEVGEEERAKRKKALKQPLLFGFVGVTCLSLSSRIALTCTFVPNMEICARDGFFFLSFSSLSFIRESGMFGT